MKHSKNPLVFTLDTLYVIFTGKSFKQDLRKDMSRMRLNSQEYLRCEKATERQEVIQNVSVYLSTTLCLASSEALFPNSLSLCQRFHVCCTHLLKWPCGVLLQQLIKSNLKPHGFNSLSSSLYLYRNKPRSLQSKIKKI